MAEFNVPNFGGGLNESVHPSLIAPNEASYLLNVDIRNGSLKPIKLPKGMTDIPLCPVQIATLMVYFNGNNRHFVAAGEGKLYLYNGTSWVLLGQGHGSNNWDFINYKYNNVDVMILVNGVDNNKILEGVTLRDMKDRRISYDASGVIDGYYDANGVKKATEAEVTTLAPKAKFIELHFERIWLGDDKSVYFSKDFDPEDFTIPVTELEANQHGGEIVMESFDATKIIGMKVVFNDVVIFKEKSLFKIVGAYAEQYEKIQLFNFNGAIADRSIVVTSKGAFFLNTDGIYQYDGVNCSIISEKAQKTLAKFSRNTLHEATAVNFDNKYIVTAKGNVNGSTSISVEFDYENNLFTVCTYGVLSFLNVIHDLYGITGEAVNGKRIYEYGEGGFAIVEWQSGTYTLDAPNAVKEIEDIYIVGKGTEIGVGVRTERKLKEKAITLKNGVTHKPFINFGRQFSYHIIADPQDLELSSLKFVMDVDMD